MSARRPAIIGPYAVEDTLGFGGMGEVLRGRHRLIDRLVAIKIRKRTRSREEHRLADRFRHTATLQGELIHPHITQVYDYLEMPDQQALVLEYLAGGSVADLLLRGPLAAQDATRIAIHAAEALAYAHARGIVHRDIKPDNLMLQHPGDVSTLRVTDFGVAKSVDRSPHLTVAGANVGTVWYMSPEQFNGETPSPAFDIYSLGATTYEMLTGKVPFDSHDTAEIFKRFLDGSPVPPIRRRNPAVSRALAAVVEAAISLDLRQRPPSAAAFALLLRAVAETDGFALDDQAARRLFEGADGPALRHMLRVLPDAGGAEANQAFTYLDSRINGATAVTRVGGGRPLLEVMLEDDQYDEAFEEEEDDHTLVMPVIDVDEG